MDIKTTYNVKKGTPESLTNFNKLSNKDLPLIQTQNIDTQFNQGKHRVDVHFYSLDGRLLQSKVNSTNYSIQAGSSNVLDEVVDIILDPQKDVIEAGYDNGDINVLYNFVNTLYSNSNTRPIFYVESISPDRREIRALTNDLDKDTIIDFTNQIKSRLEEQPYFEDFRTNFGKNKLPIAVNIETTEYKGDQAILIRFYDTLPTEFTVKSTFLVEELIGNSVLYEVTTKVDAEAVDDIVTLRGANYNIELVEENNNPTGYLNYNELFSYPVTNSYYEVYSLFNEKGAQISIDHTDYSEFIQFSSAEERIRNFYYKASLLESYRNQIDDRVAYTASIEENIRGIVNNFDHFDRFLYFETGSSAWPKSSSTRPYTLYSTGSTEVQSWYTDKINSAALYDAQNQDRLTNTIPSFIREDLNNAPYSLFVDMIGQHFDNLWIYSKAVTSKYDADNRLDFGISKDLVRDAVENFGITLYNNNEALENLFSAFTGESYDSGSEVISSLIVAVEGSGSLVGSAGNEHLQPMPKSSYQKEVYKRIYHNIPLLLKSKGTERGLRALINSLGIPSDTLSIKMYGGATESGSIFYGPETEFTSSLDKIRITNTDTITTGSTLSNFTSVVQPGRDYSTDLHTVEVGFSPTDNLNRFIKAHPSMSSFNIDEYIGDPSLAYSSSYASLDDLADTVFTSGSSYVNVYNAFDFVRLIKFFDNSLFRIIKDFVPARSNISTGIVIKPHLLDRSKIKQPEVKWSNQTSPDFIHTGTQLDYTGSYYSTNFSIDGNIETAFITGSTGLDSGYTSSYAETYANPSGGFQTLTRNNHDEASYTGEYSGSIVRVSNGELTSENVFKHSSLNLTGSEEFRISNYNSLKGDINSLRKSGRILKVDDSTYSPTQGTFQGFFVPGNFEIISSSIANGVQDLDERFFAEVQDSNYDSVSWKNGRYEGSKATSKGIVGREPSLTFASFEGSKFETNVETAEIKTKFSGSETKTGDVEVYYHTYSGNIYSITSFDTAGSGVNGPTFLETSNTSFKFQLGSDSQQMATYSASLSPQPSSNSNISIKFTVEFQDYFGNVPTLEVYILDGGVSFSSRQVNLTEGYNADPGRTKTLENLEVVLNADTSITDLGIEFRFLNMSDSYGSDIILTTITSIQDVELFPIQNSDNTIYKLVDSGSFQTHLYEKQKPTPSSPEGFIKLTEKKIYKLDTTEVLTTNDKGIVINIE